MSASYEAWNIDVLRLKRDYREAVEAYLQLIQNGTGVNECALAFARMHSAATDFFNHCEIKMGALLVGNSENEAAAQDMVETSAAMLADTPTRHYTLVRKDAPGLGLDPAVYEPNENGFANIQRAIRRYLPARVTEIKKKLEDCNLPVSGFENPFAIASAYVVSPAVILKQTEVATGSGQFILGCFDQRVTLYSQQVRALNLIFSLLEEQRIVPGDEILVIGAGVAGLTAAAAAALSGCKVTLLEKEQDVLPILRGNHTRWLHPNIYDWPRTGSHSPDARLPVLNWQAGLADAVCAQLLAEWNAVVAKRHIKTFLSTKDINLAATDCSWRSGGFQCGSFKTVILAVGFGIEAPMEQVPVRSYWANDDLHQMPYGRTCISYLVSGCGDGGLIDVLRLRLRDFRHDKVLDEILTHTTKEIEDRLQEIDKNARAKANPAKELTAGYRALELPTELIAAVKGRLRTDTAVTLNGRDIYPFGLGSCIFNRFLVHVLFQCDPTLGYKAGLARTVSADGGSFKVSFDGGVPEVYDQVVCRHGPKSALEAGFKTVFDNSTQLKSSAGGEQTRYPIYGNFLENWRQLPSI
jgi:hypothetical protein